MIVRNCPDGNLARERAEKNSLTRKLSDEEVFRERLHTLGTVSLAKSNMREICVVTLKRNVPERREHCDVGC